MFKCTDVEQKWFDKIKSIVAQDTLLAYPHFNKRFDIHTYPSDYQLGALIGQYGKPTAFYRRKLTIPQTGYTVME